MRCARSVRARRGGRTRFHQIPRVLSPRRCRCAACAAAQYIDDVYIGCVPMGDPFDGNPVFGPSGIRAMLLGQYGKYSDTTGEYTQLSKQDQFRGRMKNFQVYDYSKTAAEVTALFSGVEQLTGTEQGLVIFYKMDEGSGSILHNLGSAGTKYNAVLGEYANGESSTTDTFGKLNECDETLIGTKPQWPGTSVTNSKPTVESQTTTVRRAQRDGRPSRPWLRQSHHHASACPSCVHGLGRWSRIQPQLQRAWASSSTPRTRTATCSSTLWNFCRPTASYFSSVATRRNQVKSQRCHSTPGPGA